MISIVLPCYNGETYLRDALDSILAQTYRDWELIFVNDCSTDQSLAIAEEYATKDERIRILTNERNLRLPGSLNRGFRASCGEYLTWTSDDNLLEPDALAYLLSEIEKGYDLVYSNMTYIDGDGNILPEDNEGGTIWERNVVGASFLYRRTIYETIGDYREEMYLVEDYDYWLRAAKTFRLHYCPRKVYRYRRHGASLSATKEAQRRKVHLRLMEELISDPGIPEEGKDALRRKLMQDYADEGRTEDFRALFRYLREKGALPITKMSKGTLIRYWFGEKIYWEIKKILRKE